MDLRLAFCLVVGGIFWGIFAFAYDVWVFIRYRRLAWIACFGFFNEEYLIALVDFIAPCGGTIERGERDLRIPFSPPSGLPPSFLGESLRRDIIAAAGLYQYWCPVSGADCLSPLRFFVWVLCVRVWTVRVSEDFVGHISHVFHWWWDGLFVSAATWGVAVAFRGFARNVLRRLTRGWIDCFG